MKIEVNITKAKFFFLLFAFILISGAFFVYATYTGPIPNPGHGGDSVLVSVNGEEMTLQQALDQNKIGGTTAREFVLNDSGNRIGGLTPGRIYLVSIYGITSNRGNDGATLNSIGVRDCTSGNIVGNTPSISMNWPDGSAPHSASLVIAAPASGCLSGFADGSVLYINAISL